MTSLMNTIDKPPTLTSLKPPKLDQLTKGALKEYFIMSTNLN